MTAKEYLNRAKHIDDLINYRLRELDYWRDMQGRVSGSNFEPHYNPNKQTEAPFVRVIEKIDELEREIEEKIRRLMELKEEISNAIDMLESHDEQMVLRYRYLDRLSWEEISHMMYVSERTVYRIHGEALAHFTVP